MSKATKDRLGRLSIAEDSTPKSAFGLGAGSNRAAGAPVGLSVAVFVLALASSLGSVLQGPALGDHEAIVAECAREMRLSGDWLVPRFLGTSFLRKPPLPVWMVAAASYLFDNDPRTGLPVTATSARLPSALCALGTVLLLWRLASRMFDRRVGIAAAIVSSSSVALLLYGPNATAEMPLMFGCTWAYYHFWFAATNRTKRGRLWHSMAFYTALGFAMLAKGPAPVGLVGFPLAVWWYVHRPARLIARGGAGAGRKVIALFFRGLIPQTARVFTRLWFFPGILWFGLLFVPWMIAAADRQPHAWELWNWQFLQRAKGDFPDTRHRSIAYYIPILGGLVLPWTFLVIEASMAPWVRRYARWHRPLLYSGLWILLGALSMSLMEFKKPYYVLPAVGGFLLLIAVAADRAFLSSLGAAAPKSWTLRMGVALQFAALVGAALMGMGDALPWGTGPRAAVVAAGILLFGGAFAALRSGRGPWVLAAIALVSMASFHTVWNFFGRTIENIDMVSRLAATLETQGVPPDARLFWADRRPDARLAFYFNRKSEQMVDPHEIVGAGILNRRTDKHLLEKMAIQRALGLLSGSEPVYMIIGKDHFDRLKAMLEAHANALATVPSGEKPSRHDWVLVTNAKRIPVSP